LCTTQTSGISGKKAKNLMAHNSRCWPRSILHKSNHPFFLTKKFYIFFCDILPNSPRISVDDDIQLFVAGKAGDRRARWYIYSLFTMLFKVRKLLLNNFVPQTDTAPFWSNFPWIRGKLESKCDRL